MCAAHSTNAAATLQQCEAAVFLNREKEESHCVAQEAGRDLLFAQCGGYLKSFSSLYKT